MNRSIFGTVFILALGLNLAISGAALAQTKSKGKRRPKIGVAFGGGGAKGGTQLGVLKVMREARVPIDYISGTSMGSFVGALYAAGLSLEEIESVLADTNWVKVMSPETPRETTSMLRKEEDLTYLAKIKLGMKGFNVQLPSGIVSRQRLNLVLRKALFPLSDLKSFDDLPIPLRTVAADLDRGREVVLGSGDVAKAVMASMAVPGLFSPVEWEGKKLVDGGVANNVPVSVVEKMGAEVVIAIDISATFKDVKDVKSFTAVVDQINTMLTRGNVEETIARLAPQHIFIRPDFGGVNTADYDRIAETFVHGEEAAREVLPRLKALSVSESEYAAYQKKRIGARAKAPQIHAIRVKNESNISSKTLERPFRSEVGNSVDLDEVKKEIDALYGTMNFSSVDYKVEEKDGKSDLVINAKANEATKDYLRFGLRLETNFTTQAAFDMGFRYVKTQINRYGAEWINTLNVGSRLMYHTTFIQPFEPGLRYYVAPSFVIGREDVHLYDAAGNVTSLSDVGQLEPQFSIGRYLGNWGDIRALYYYQYAKQDERLPNMNAPRINYENSGYSIRMLFDTLDEIYFPRKGVFSALSWRHGLKSFGSDFGFQKITASVLGSLSFGKSTFTASGKFDTVLDENAPDTELAKLGGLFQLSGTTRDQFSGQHEILGRLFYYYQLTMLGGGMMNMPLYLGASFEMGNTYNSYDAISFDSLRMAGSAFIAAGTFFGPITFAGGMSEGGAKSFYLSIGQYFGNFF